MNVLWQGDGVLIQDRMQPRRANLWLEPLQLYSSAGGLFGRLGHEDFLIAKRVIIVTSASSNNGQGVYRYPDKVRQLREYFQNYDNNPLMYTYESTDTATSTNHDKMAGKILFQYLPRSEYTVVGQDVLPFTGQTSDGWGENNVVRVYVMNHHGRYVQPRYVQPEEVAIHYSQDLDPGLSKENNELFEEIMHLDQMDHAGCKNADLEAMAARMDEEERRCATLFRK